MFRCLVCDWEGEDEDREWQEVREFELGSKEPVFIEVFAECPYCGQSEFEEYWWYD